MYPTNFEYVRAESVEEAVALLRTRADEDVRLLAGGHGLIPQMKVDDAHPAVLVDIGHLSDLDGIERDGGTLSIGALVTHAEIADSTVVDDASSALADAARALGDPQVRNGGTIGGNVAHADPPSDPPAALLAADASVVAVGPDGERRLSVDDFFRGAFETALAPDELVTAIDVPAQAANEASAYLKYRDPLTGYALVGVAAKLAGDGDSIEAARVAVTGVLDRATRLDGVEDALAGAALTDETFADAAVLADDGIDEADVRSDVQASAAYRLGVLPVYVERSITAAADRLDAE
ncbi:FAD binding domain-containing protein [Haloferacaceae archaeon DSL9]